MQSVREVIATVEGINAPVPIVEDAKPSESSAAPAVVYEVFDLVNQANAAEAPA